MEAIDDLERIKTIAERHVYFKKIVGQTALLKAEACERFSRVDMGDGKLSLDLCNTRGADSHLFPGEYVILGVGSAGAWLKVGRPGNEDVEWFVPLLKVAGVTPEEIAELQTQASSVA